MECQNDHALSLLPPIPEEYHYEVEGCGYGWMSLGLVTVGGVGLLSMSVKEEAYYEI